MKVIPKSVLEEYYLKQKLTPYKIAEILNVNHKTVRSYLKKHDIPLRGASEYNYLPRKSHESPNHQQLFTKLSVAGHSAFLCEGWHTEKTNAVYFCNTDPSLIFLIIRMLEKTYRVNKIRLQIVANNKSEAKPLYDIFPKSSFVREKGRKTPLVRLFCGGKNLAREVIENAYKVVTSFY